MHAERIEELLLTLIKDMAEVKAKLDNIEGQELGSRIDRLEAQNREHDKTIKSLEHRCDTMEKFVRDSLTDKNRTSRSVFISAGLAIFGAIVSMFINLL